MGANFEHKVDDYLFIFHLVHIEIIFFWVKIKRVLIFVINKRASYFEKIYITLIKVIII